MPNPYDGYLNPLEHTPDTILRGLAGITSHPNRNCEHKSYQMVNMESNNSNTMPPESPGISRKKHNKTMCIPTNTSFLSDGTFPYNSIVKPENWIPPTGVDADCPNSMLRAIPILSDRAKQIYIVWVSFVAKKSKVATLGLFQKRRRIKF